jgi:hypothetical protein
MSKRKTKIEKPFWQDTPCPPWCQGHHDDLDVIDDREHGWEDPRGLPLSTHEPVKYLRSEKTAPTTLWINLVQGYREREARVNIHQGFGTAEEQVELSLTLAEAEKVIRRLTKAIHRAKGGSR